MFAPATQAVREKLIRGVFELDQPDYVEDGRDVEVGEDSDKGDVDMADAEASPALSEEDNVAYQDIQDLEEHFNMYQAVRYNISLASFVPNSQDVELKDLASVQSALSPTDPEARHILYRLKGFYNLIHELRAVRCTHPSLLSQRDNLTTASELEIERTLRSLQEEREFQTQTGIPGIRRVSVGASL
ncbi:hypothetical protein FRC07_004209 [Ceratobasidium sp. 392]|nr:hypothetical protein FRC07_004209 [Ceratobasidium sp. 392]